MAEAFGVTRVPGEGHGGRRLRAALAQLPLPAGPLADQTVPPHAGHGAGPDAAGDEIGDLREVGVMAVARDDGLLGEAGQRRLGGGEKAGAEQDALGPEGEGGGEAATVGDASCGEHRQRCHGVDGHGDEGECRHQADVATAFGALRHDDVGAGSGSSHRLRYLTDHVHHQRSGRVGSPENGLQRLVKARPRERCNRRPLGQHGVNGGVIGCEQKQVEAEGLGGKRANPSGRLLDLRGAEATAAENTETARVRDGGNQFR